MQPVIERRSIRSRIGLGNLGQRAKADLLAELELNWESDKFIGLVWKDADGPYIDGEELFVSHRVAPNYGESDLPTYAVFPLRVGLFDRHVREHAIFLTAREIITACECGDVRRETLRKTVQKTEKAVKIAWSAYLSFKLTREDLRDFYGDGLSVLHALRSVESGSRDLDRDLISSAETSASKLMQAVGGLFPAHKVTSRDVQKYMTGRLPPAADKDVLRKLEWHTSKEVEALREECATLFRKELYPLLQDLREAQFNRQVSEIKAACEARISQDKTLDQKPRVPEDLIRAHLRQSRDPNATTYALTTPSMLNFYLIADENAKLLKAVVDSPMRMIRKVETSFDDLCARADKDGSDQGRSSFMESFTDSLESSAKSLSNDSSSGGSGSYSSPIDTSTIYDSGPSCDG